ncbi:multicopper oxidase family protein [Nevskia soli]|uniref:multicopper oxidase family protein n=1 Tax=Nevskia soli TaxID=418856 RepID=UPI0015D6FAC4|nr:multicopper oxidase family protein [Nevskia soli]
MTRRDWLKASGLATHLLAGQRLAHPQTRPDYALTIGPCSWELSPRRTIKTTAYNGQVPGPLLGLREGQPVTIDVTNQTQDHEVVHWHGLFLPSQVDGAMEEGTPPIPPGRTARYTFTPRPAGFRWYHTHVSAGTNFSKGQYTGQHGFLWVEPRENPGRYDQEIFLTLHDWRGQMLASDDGSMNPSYDLSTVNGRVLGFGDPLRVRAGRRVLLHLLNSSATEVHWISLSGHSFYVVALDGNAIPQPASVSMLRLAPAERISAIVVMNNPGVWVLGEVRKHIQAAGMGVVVEYAGQSGKPSWEQPDRLIWDYLRFAAASIEAPASAPESAIDIPLVFESKFAGHGAMDHWTINGRSFPNTETVALKPGNRYRLIFKNRSKEDHPVHLHRHLFELMRSGIRKDTVLVEAGTELPVEFTADNPGATLFHCHQQNHMDAGFMMLFRYA